MLFYKFRNFEEFNELFGIQHHGNGEKSRKNKILLSYIKVASYFMTPPRPATFICSIFRVWQS